jgi:putative hemolysin
LDPEPIHISQLILSANVGINSIPENSIAIYGVALLLLVIFSAIISAAEVAYLSFGLKNARDIEDEESEISDLVMSLKERPKHLLSTFIILNTLSTIACVVVMDRILHQLIGQQWFVDVSSRVCIMLGFVNVDGVKLGYIFQLLLTIIIIVFTLVIFCESVPKLYARERHKSVMFSTAHILTFFNYLLAPINNIFVLWTTGIERSYGHSPNKIASQAKEDIDAAIDLTVIQHSATSTQEADLLKGIVNFGDISARQIMHPRVDIVAIEDNVSYKELMRVIRDSNYSRLPIYCDDLDNIKGIIYVKDLLAHHAEPDNFEWQSLIRNTVLFVPEAKKIDELLREFQRKRAHMAIIVDEYGGTAGIATLEDIMEEIVGDIKDEFDQDEEVNFIKISDKNYIFDGKTLLKDICKVININPNTFDEHRKDADSIGGLILEIVGQIPTSDREIQVDNISLKVVTVSKRRIEKVSLIIHEK